MTDLPTKYDPSLTEERWYKYWMEEGFFRSLPDEREPYTIVIPPPNVTGVLHMGHMLNNTIQDVLIRKARMDGMSFRIERCGIMWQISGNRGITTRYGFHNLWLKLSPFELEP